MVALLGLALAMTVVEGAPCESVRGPHFLGDRVAVDIACRAGGEKAVLEFVLRQVGKKGQGAISEFTLAFFGLVEEVRAPKGWLVERRAQPVSGATELVWRATQRRHAVKRGKDASGFGLTLSGEAARLDCNWSYKDTELGGGVGGCVS